MKKQLATRAFVILIHKHLSFPVQNLLIQFQETEVFSNE